MTDIGRAKGILVAVGGAEDKTSDRKVLRAVVDLAEGGAGVVEIVPTASGIPDEVGHLYVKAFEDLGVKEARVLDVRTRADAGQTRNVRRIEDADVVYLTGGDQLRLTSVLGGSPVLQAIQDRYQAGGVVAGTSAGAAAMSATMIFEGGASAGALQKGNVQMTPGLGLLSGAVIDTRFIDRGRFSRLLEAVTANPGHVGLGLGEDTGVVVREGHLVEVVGTGLVVVVDGHQLRHSNLSRATRGEPIVVENMVIHTLAEGYGYDLATQRFLLPRDVAEVLEVEA